MPLRHWEVMATGRTLLICDRPTDERTYGVDIVEDEHAVMFSSEEEFMEKVAYYTENEAARARIVKKAYEHVQRQHDWFHRGQAIHESLRQVCPAESWRASEQSKTRAVVPSVATKE